MVRGKISICNRCGDQMIMGALQLSLAKPHCLNCVRSKELQREKFKGFIEKTVARDSL